MKPSKIKNTDIEWKKEKEILGNPLSQTQQKKGIAFPYDPIYPCPTLLRPFNSPYSLALAAMHRACRSFEK